MPSDTRPPERVAESAVPSPSLKLYTALLFCRIAQTFSATRGSAALLASLAVQTTNADSRDACVSVWSTMSSDGEIGAPFTLASLPHMISSTGGRIHATSVCSVSGSKKRKRTEIAVALDGEGIFIYSVSLYKCTPDILVDNH